MVDRGVMMRVLRLTDDALSMWDLMGKGGKRTGELEGPDVDCPFHQANINKILLSSKEGISTDTRPATNHFHLFPLD